MGRSKLVVCVILFFSQRSSIVLSNARRRWGVEELVTAAGNDVCVCVCAAMDTVRMSASLWPNTEPGQGPIGQRSCVLFDDER